MENIAMPNRAEMAALLEATGDYRILRRLPKIEIATNPRPGFTHLGVILDTETTGLRRDVDEVIEIGAIAFQYSHSGEIGDVVDVFSALQQPSRPIPADVSQLTGITDEMVKGFAIQIQQLEAFIAPAELIIAHNASFDRPFCERLSSIFANKPWCCSHNEINWRARGYEGTKLGYLLSQSGLFHDGHRAIDDCYALFEIMRGAEHSLRSPFAELLLSSRRERVRIWAEHSPFDKKDVLKERGYRWSSGENHQPKSWWTELDSTAVQSELTYLQTHIYGRPDAQIKTRRLTALDRFRG